MKHSPSSTGGSSMHAPGEFHNTAAATPQQPKQGGKLADWLPARGRANINPMHLLCTAHALHHNRCSHGALAADALHITPPSSLTPFPGLLHILYDSHCQPHDARGWPAATVPCHSLDRRPPAAVLHPASCTPPTGGRVMPGCASHPHCLCRCGHCGGWRHRCGRCWRGCGCC